MNPNNEPKTREQEYDEKYPAKDYEKKVFNFTQAELKEMKAYEQSSLDAQVKAYGANQLINILINMVLKRAGVKDSPAVQASYDSTRGVVITWEPRKWCSVCNNARAEFQADGKIYCPTCVAPVREALAKQVVETAKEAVVKPVETKETKEVKKKK